MCLFYWEYGSYRISLAPPRGPKNTDVLKIVAFFEGDWYSLSLALGGVFLLQVFSVMMTCFLFFGAAGHAFAQTDVEQAEELGIKAARLINAVDTEILKFQEMASTFIANGDRAAVSNAWAGMKENHEARLTALTFEIDGFMKQFKPGWVGVYFAFPGYMDFTSNPFRSLRLTVLGLWHVATKLHKAVAQEFAVWSGHSPTQSILHQAMLKAFFAKRTYRQRNNFLSNKFILDQFLDRPLSQNNPKIQLEVLDVKSEMRAALRAFEDYLATNPTRIDIDQLKTDLYVLNAELKNTSATGTRQESGVTTALPEVAYGIVQLGTRLAIEENCEFSFLGQPLPHTPHYFKAD